MKVFRICQNCNEEFELPDEDFITIIHCPHCQARNDVWIRKVHYQILEVDK